jgi:hypothetical protein
MKLLLLFSALILILLTGCSQKKLTVSALHPGKVEKKYHSIRIFNFINDDINQKISLEEALVNKVINGKRVFNLKYDNDVDVILNGEVLESSLFLRPYYNEKIDYNRCIKFSEEIREKDKKTKDKKVKRVCERYKIIRVPCEERDYKVSTKVDLIDAKNRNLLFTKIYTNTYSENFCFNNHHRNYIPHQIPRNKYEINSNLASELSNEIIKDISPHYVYFNIPIMSELDDNKIKYLDTQIDDFDLIIDLLISGNIEKAKEKLESFDARSVEAIYNLALIYEYKNQLEYAHKLYEQAYKMTDNIEYLRLINSALNRTKINLEEKIKAKSQLP